MRIFDRFGVDHLGPNFGHKAPTMTNLVIVATFFLHVPQEHDIQLI